MSELNGFLQVFVGGMLGPFLVELVKLSKWRNGREIAARYRQAGYWVATLSLLVLGGLVTSMHGVEHVPPLRAVHLGTAAPLLVGAWASAKSAAQWRGAAPGMTGRPSLRDLLAW